MSLYIRDHIPEEPYSGHVPMRPNLHDFVIVSAGGHAEPKYISSSVMLDSAMWRPHTGSAWLNA